LQSSEELFEDRRGWLLPDILVAATALGRVDVIVVVIYIDPRCPMVVPFSLVALFVARVRRHQGHRNLLLMLLKHLGLSLSFFFLSINKGLAEVLICDLHHVYLK
jgi:hypothetical protein